MLKLGNGAIGTQKQQNKKKKRERKKEGAQAPPMLKLRDGIHLHQKQQNKKIKRGGITAPSLLIVGDGA